MRCFTATFLIATALVFAMLSGVLASPRFNEERNVYGLSKLGGRTVANNAAAIFNGNNLMNLRWDLCSCCGQNTENYCCGSNIWSCTCDDCCPGCEAKGKRGGDAALKVKVPRAQPEDFKENAPRGATNIKVKLPRSENVMVESRAARGQVNVVDDAATAKVRGDAAAADDIVVARAPFSDKHGDHKRGHHGALVEQQGDVMPRGQLQHETANEAHLH